MKTNTTISRYNKYHHLYRKFYHSSIGRMMLKLTAICCLLAPLSSYAADANDALSGLGLHKAASGTFGPDSVLMGVLFIGEFIGLVLLYVTGPKNPKIFLSIVFLMIVVPVGFAIVGKF